VLLDEETDRTLLHSLFSTDMQK